MAVNLDRVRSVQVSTALQETAYDTAVAVDSLIKVNAGVIAMEKADISDDTDLIGGTEEADDQTVLAKHVELPFAQSKARPHTLAFLAAHAMGAVNASLVGTVYKHHFTPTTSFTTLPSFTAEVLLKTGVQYKYSGMFVDSFDLSVSRGADRRVSLSASCFGSGTRVTGSASTSEFAESALNATTAQVWLAATTYAGTTGDALSVSTEDLTSGGSGIKADLVSLDWNYSNNVDLDFLYEIGGGLGPNLASRVARSQTVSMVVLFDDYTYLTGMLDQTNYAIQVVVQGDEEDTGPSRYEGFNLIWPKARVSVADVQEQGGRLVMAMEVKPLQDSTYGSVLLDVFTQKAAYIG
tara:strand:+ start:23961 stop:25013 length:1053 start_codon:yes stop_codon:yes gene_type:complete